MVKKELETKEETRGRSICHGRVLESSRLYSPGLSAKWLHGMIKELDYERHMWPNPKS